MEEMKAFKHHQPWKQQNHQHPAATSSKDTHYQEGIANSTSSSNQAMTSSNLVMTISKILLLIIIITIIIIITTIIIILLLVTIVRSWSRNNSSNNNDNHHHQHHQQQKHEHTKVSPPKSQSLGNSRWETNQPVSKSRCRRSVEITSAKELARTSVSPQGNGEGIQYISNEHMRCIFFWRPVSMLHSALVLLTIAR